MTAVEVNESEFLELSYWLEGKLSSSSFISLPTKIFQISSGNIPRALSALSLSLILSTSVNALTQMICQEGLLTLNFPNTKHCTEPKEKLTCLGS